MKTYAQDEVWKVTHISQYHEISNFGRLRTVDKKVWHGKGFWFTRKSKILSLQVHQKGYLIYVINKKVCFLHRLVAIAFIPNLNDKPQVNHINGNKKDNHYTNLEWCTGSENVKHSYDTRLKKSYREREVCDLETGLFFHSLSDAWRTLNLPVTIRVLDCGSLSNKRFKLI